MGMRFPIDVVYLDREGFVVKIVPWLHPWRVSSGGRDAASALELVAGEAARLGIATGRLVRLPRAPMASRPSVWSAVALAALAGAGGVAIGLGRGAPFDPLALGAFFAALAVASVVDLRERRIPNALTYPGIVVALGLAAARGAGAESLAGLLGAGGFMAVGWLAGRGRLGVGDITFAVFIGAAIGLAAVPAFLLIATASGALAALGALLARRDRRATLAFGPWLALGGAAAALLHGLPPS
jgi:leader peptidase (prepilin peptidase)/N-methyltransferase